MDRNRAEQLRLRSTNRRETDWKRWGPYLAERAWGTVREDYSADGSAWNYFPFVLKRWPHSRIGRWMKDYPGRPKLILQLLFAPAAHVLAWIHQGGRLTISAQKPR